MRLLKAIKNNIMSKIIKRTIIILCSIALVSSVIFAVAKYNQGKKIVKVMSVSNASTYYYGDALETSGQVAADNSQVVWVTKDHKISEVLVKEGDEVNEGDVLMRFEKKDETDAISQAELSLATLKNTARLDEIRLARVYAMGPGIKDWSALEEKNEYKPCIETTYTEKEYGFTVARTVTDVDGHNLIFYPGEYGGFSEDDLADIESKSILQKDFDELGSPADTDKLFIKNVNTDATYLAYTEYYIGDDWMGEQKYNMKGEITKKFDPDKRGYTQKQIDQMVKSLEKSCARNRISIAEQELKLATMKEKQESGEVVAKYSGKITKLQDINAINFNSAFLVLTSGDGYYVAGGIGEMFLDQYGEGTVISCNNYANGTFATATITEVEPFPTNSFSSYSEGNTNTSTYKFKAQLSQTEGFEIGDYLGITFTADGVYDESTGGATGQNLYIEKPFVRKDDSGSFVMIMDENGRLKKQRIRTGKTVWGAYIEIKEGLTQEDYIAFPYGDGAKEGVKCEISDTVYMY